MLTVDKETFEQEVLQAEGYVLVDFYGDGCEPCKALMPFVEGLAEKYGDKIKFVKLNTISKEIGYKSKVWSSVIAIYNNGKSKN